MPGEKFESAECFCVLFKTESWNQKETFRMENSGCLFFCAEKGGIAEKEQMNRRQI